jgi:hypothetical protein
LYFTFVLESLGARHAVEDDDALPINRDQRGIHAERPRRETKQPAQSRQLNQLVKGVRQNCCSIQGGCSGVAYFARMLRIIKAPLTVSCCCAIIVGRAADPSNASARLLSRTNEQDNPHTSFAL